VHRKCEGQGGSDRFGSCVGVRLAPGNRYSVAQDSYNYDSGQSVSQSVSQSVYLVVSYIGGPPVPYNPGV
jgi:hypothetical protein